MSTPSREYASTSLQPNAASAGERLAGAAGLAVVVFILVAGFFSPDPPSHGAPDEAVRAFYQQHAVGLLAGAFLWGLGMMALLVFALALSRACNRSHLQLTQPFHTQPQSQLFAAELMRLFSVAAATMFLVSQATGGAGAVLARHGAPAITVRALDEISHLVGHLATLPLGSFLLAAGTAQITAHRGARWIAWLGLAAGITLVVTTIWIAIGHQWLHHAGVVGLLAFLLWSAASSISLLRARRLPGATLRAS